jgi:nucleoside-diphosphate-sugar epimerase
VGLGAGTLGRLTVAPPAGANFSWLDHMKVFVTGHQGYIGSQLVDVLKQEGHFVIGCDLNLFEGCAWEALVEPDRALLKDIRGVEAADLEGCDCVMHLAAISNDPMGALNAQITFDVNRDASIRLAKVAKEAGVLRYLFAGSCSVYGKGEKLDLEESDPLNPLTAYAQSKIETEKAVSALADDGFTPVFLRNATAYGHSPMLRVDLVVNNLLASAMAYGEIRIQSDGSPWRPLIHCRDIARAFAALAKAPRDVVCNKAINVGANSENYQVRDVGDEVQKLIAKAEITYTGEVGADPRNYRVNFDLLYRLLPDFKLQYNLRSGIEELHRKMVEHGFSKQDFEGDQFVRLRALRKQFHRLG